jgi:hypothetical protein
LAAHILVICGIGVTRHRGMSIAAFGVIAAPTFAAQSHADDPTVQQDCTAKSWPQPLPNAVGQQLEDIVNDDSFWICLNIAAIAPDGHDVMDDNSGFTESWRITSRSPESGTPVAENETVTLNVSR